MRYLFTGILFTILLIVAVLMAPPASGQELDGIKDQHPVQISGNLSVVNTFYHAWGIQIRRPPYYWLFNGNINFSFYGVDVPISATVSQQQRQFVQPFNQYGLSPSYKSVTVHGGYRTMPLSELTLGSNVFLGVGVEYAPSNLPIKISAMRGRLIAPTPPGTYRNGVELPATYKRTGQGIKLAGYHKGDQLDLTIFSASDDPNSISINSSSDTSAYLLTPEENAIIELDLKKRIAQRISLQLKYAQSLFNLDSRSPEIESDDFINKLLKPLIKTNGSTQNSKAIIGKISYNGDNFNVYVNYRRIDPEYKSMGSIFLTNDLEDISTGLNVTLFENKVNLDINGGIQYNNLNEDKISRMKRMIAGVNLFYNINEKSNLTINYSNFNSSTVYSAFTTLDSLNYVQVTQNAGVSFNHSFSNDNKNSLFVQGNSQRLTDSNQSDAYLFNFSSGYQSKINPLFSGSAAVNYTNNTSGNLITNSIGPSISLAAQKSKKLRAGLSVVWLYAFLNGDITNKYKTYSLTANWRFGDHQSITSKISFLDRIRVAEQKNHMAELRMEINYNYTF